MNKDELNSILEQHRLWNCKIAQLEAELKITDELLKEATETIGAVVACCTYNSYNSNDDAKIGIYGIDQKAFTRIDQFITHYNDAISAGKVSVDVKRELTDAEIEELGAQEAERKEFCPNCEAETPCTHEAELFVCDICGEDFAKYIVSRYCNVSDVSMTQDVLTDIKTPSSIENTNPDYYKQELARIAELSQAVGLITTLKPTMVMDANHPLDMAKEVAEYVNARIAELEGKIDQLTAHSDIERQDDKWIPEVQE
jgi:ribosomal protein L37AE/L43A